MRKPARCLRPGLRGPAAEPWARPGHACVPRRHTPACVIARDRGKRKPSRAPVAPKPTRCPRPLRACKHGAAPGSIPRAARVITRVERGQGVDLVREPPAAHDAERRSKRAANPRRPTGRTSIRESLVPPRHSSSTRGYLSLGWLWVRRGLFEDAASATAVRRARALSGNTYRYVVLTPPQRCKVDATVPLRSLPPTLFALSHGTRAQRKRRPCLHGRESRLRVPTGLWCWPTASQNLVRAACARSLDVPPE